MNAYLAKPIITYRVLRLQPSRGDIAVFVSGKRTGTIKSVQSGYQYFPTGQKTGGELFVSLTHCKRSLEG